MIAQFWNKYLAAGGALVIIGFIAWLKATVTSKRNLEVQNEAYKEKEQLRDISVGNKNLAGSVLQDNLDSELDKFDPDGTGGKK